MDAHGITRRQLLKGLGLLSIAALFPFKISLAAAPTEQRLLVVILRGAMDGLGAVVPYGDKFYTEVRGGIAMPLADHALIPLNDYFAMPQVLAPLAQLFQQKELAILHATAMPYRSRSHFDAQDVLENGGLQPHGLSTGWLNRAVNSLHGEAVALGPTVPLILRGQARVTSWAPSMLPPVEEDFLSRVLHMYQDDPLLTQALMASQEIQQMGNAPGGNGNKAFAVMMAKAAQFLSAPNGPRIGTVDIDGWDTHAGQGLHKGRLPNALDNLTKGLLAFREGMGAAWRQTAVLVITEFGRTVRGNGSGGTDHGTASCAFLLGGQVNGGQVLGDWPGLQKLYEDRDLYPANDLRSLLKGTLAQHLHLTDPAIFPESQGANALPHLFRV